MNAIVCEGGRPLAEPARSHPCGGCGRIGGLPDRRPILVGEANPYGGDPRYALYPEPERSAGGRLCRAVMGLEVREYLRRFDRRNLCAEKWSSTEARLAAAALAAEADGRTVVLLGTKVCAAFNVAYEPFLTRYIRVFSREDADDWSVEYRIVILPHPSGRCRAWNSPGAFERASTVLREAGVLPLAPP